MSNQSITNKLIANIRQANDISKNFFTDTNRVVCIDTSNTRIGINTKTPQWSIDISGTGSYNGVKCHNLDISGKADISYALIKDLRAPTISVDFVTISNGYFKKIDASLIDISEVNFNSISGDFIYSNNTISGNFIQCFSAIILNDLDIKGTLTVENFTFERDVSFNEVNIDLSLTTQSTSNSLFQGTVDFSNSNPVTYITLSGNIINTFSLSCDNLQVNQEADFSSINVSNEASFNTINVSGEALFSSISAENITISGQLLKDFVNNNTTNLYSSNDENIDIDTLRAKKLYINDNIDNYNTRQRLQNQTFDDGSIDGSIDASINIIDKLRISEILDFSYSNSSIILPLKKPLKYLKGSIFYSLTNDVIDGLTIVTHDGNTETELDDEYKLELKKTNIKSSMYKGKGFGNLHDFSCIIFDSNFGSKNDFENENAINDANKISLNIINNEDIEINANLTVKLINDLGGGDVDAINYDFEILGYTDNNRSFSFVKNTNTILVFDNSFNYNTTSLHYIGKCHNIENTQEDTSYIFFGISYENTNKTLEFVNFNASIKSIN